MKYQVSAEDKAFQQQFESCELSPQQFSHQAHVRMAYIYLCEDGSDAAYHKMKASLLQFLNHHNVPPTKYHETMTSAWMLAVRHFMEVGDSAESFAQFIATSPKLLEFPIMLTHYSEQRLFSDEARLNFVQPDLQPIPLYAS